MCVCVLGGGGLISRKNILALLKFRYLQFSFILTTNGLICLKAILHYALGLRLGKVCEQKASKTQTKRN